MLSLGSFRAGRPDAFIHLTVPEPARFVQRNLSGGRLHGHLRLVNKYPFCCRHRNNRIRKISADGNITTVAGIGYCGISADGEAATQAGLCLPTGVATDGTGSLFIADTVLDAASEVSWRVVRKVDGSGIVTTVTGDVCGYSIQVCQSLWGGTTALRTLLSG